MEYFNKSAWREAARHSDWYLRIQPEYEALLRQAQKDSDEAEAIKESIRSFFQELVVSNGLALGAPDPELDSQRQPIRQAVIHHSHRKPGYYSFDRLNAVHLLNLYVPVYCSSDSPRRGSAISSNHYRDGKMVFFGYHWLVEMDGSATRLLPDKAIGWQAGNWEVNCQSVGICINDDLTDKLPSEAALKAVREILQTYEDNLGRRLEVVGHREVNPKTSCPGDLFLEEWKKELLAVS